MRETEIGSTNCEPAPLIAQSFWLGLAQFVID